jgi:ATP-dependent Clp protease protease subunit
MLAMLVVGLFAFLPILDEAKAAAPEISAITLSADNLLILNTEVNGDSVSKVISQARKLCAASKKSGLKGKLGLGGEPKRLKLFMNSPGGSIQSGLELNEALDGLGCKVDTVTLFSASMAWQIVQALGERYILKNGVMMSHRASGEFAGSFGGKSPSQIESRYALWMSRLTEMDAQTVSRTKGKQTLDSYQTAYSQEMWLTGRQSVDKGYSDEVVRAQCDETLTGVDTASIELFGFKISYDLDKCPLNTAPMNIRIATPDGKQIYSVTQEQEIKERFYQQFMSKQRQVVPMYW